MSIFIQIEISILVSAGSPQYRKTTHGVSSSRIGADLNRNVTLISPAAPVFPCIVLAFTGQVIFIHSLILFLLEKYHSDKIVIGISIPDNRREKYSE